ncbi:MAG: hypothetical protein ACFFE4_17935, partial [Candidatus Thorarchaeota archaeon]
MQKSKIFILSILFIVLIALFSPFFQGNVRFELNHRIKINSENESWATILHEKPFRDLSFRDSKLEVNNNSIYVVGTLNYDEFHISKCNTSGVKIWEFTLNYTLYSFDLTIDLDDFLYITGMHYNGSSSNLLLLKIDASGHVVWSKIIKSNVSAGLITLKLDQNNFLYISGYAFSSTRNIVFLSKLNSSGVVLWDVDFDTGGIGRIKMHIDSGNNIILYVGTYGSKQYLFKYNSSGSTIWHKEWGGNCRSGNIKVT